MGSRNPSGHQLSSLSWLLPHHSAKLGERRAFAQRLLEGQPEIIIDLGCGPGLWLDLFHELSNPGCRIIGVDSDSLAISTAKGRRDARRSELEFYHGDMFEAVNELPKADLYLAFNVLLFVPHLGELLEIIAERRTKNGVLAVRQFDGSTIRFGPMKQETRSKYEMALQAAVLGSRQFSYYDIDRVYSELASCAFSNIDLAFELFHRESPFPTEFGQYFQNTIRWIIEHVNETSAEMLEQWLAEHTGQDSSQPCYFSSSDLVGVMS